MKAFLLRLAAIAVLVSNGDECIATPRWQIRESYLKAVSAAKESNDYLLPAWLDRSLNIFALNIFYLAGMATGRDLIYPEEHPADPAAEKLVPVDEHGDRVKLSPLETPPGEADIVGIDFSQVSAKLNGVGQLHFKVRLPAEVDKIGFELETGRPESGLSYLGHECTVRYNVSVAGGNVKAGKEILISGLRDLPYRLMLWEDGCELRVFYFRGSGVTDLGEVDLRPAREYDFHVWSPGERSHALISHHVEGVRGLDLVEEGAVSGKPVELQIFPTGKKGELFADIENEIVYFYDYGKTTFTQVPDRTPEISRGGKILKLHHIYRVHCEAEKVDKFIWIEDFGR